MTGRRARTYAEWAREHAADFTALSLGEIAERYADGFRTGAIDRAVGLLSPDLVRVAPLETGGREVRGLSAVSSTPSA